jgi:hypothetical protein
MRRLYAPLWLAVVLLAGCQFLGIAEPQSFDQRLLVGYESVAGVRQVAATLVTSKAISVGDAENVQLGADNARAGLDIAASLKPVDPTAADARLQASLMILRALNAYLEGKQ